jgi:hypothetical protein
MSDGVALVPKIFAVIASGILALVLSGDINKNGQIKVTRGVLMRIFCSVCISVFGGSFFIESYGLLKMSPVSQGFIFLIAGAFGLLVIGIFYQSIALLRGKPLSAVIGEIAAAFKAIWSK